MTTHMFVAEADMHADAPATKRTSWVDWLQDRLATAVLPWWLMLLLVAAGLILVELLLLLLIHRMPLAAISSWRQTIFYALISPYVFGLIYVLDRRAAKAVKRLCPLFVPGTDWHHLASSISTMPPLPVLVATGGGLGLFILLHTVGHIPGEAIMAGTTALTQWIRILEGAALWMLLGVGVFHTVRQLRIINQIYTHHIKVDIFRQEPLYHLASVAAYTAIGFVIPASLGLLMFPQLLGDVLSLTVALTIFVSSAVSFIAPLYQLHQILVEQKSEQASENARLLALMLGKMRQQVEAEALEKIQESHDALAALQQDRQIVSSTPTWPWPPGSLKGMVAALLLPTLIWAIQQMLEAMLM